MNIFVSGIDTDAGKTYATAWLARQLARKGRRVVTMKFLQTGCTGSSEDIEAHRRLTGTGPLPEDAEGLTAPIIFSYPASAQLAARIDGREIDLTLIDNAMAELARRYDDVLIEGAGGLMMPITDEFMSIDYVAGRHLPVALVTNSKLGSINHTLLSLEALDNRHIPLQYLLYNEHSYGAGPEIEADTRAYLQRRLAARYPAATFLPVPEY